VLVGIVFMVLTGGPWRHLPAKALGCGSPVTLLVDRVGIPLAAGVGPANIHDHRSLKPLVGALLHRRGRDTTVPRPACL
jgi:hypothetical protein